MNFSVGNYHFLLVNGNTTINVYKDDQNVIYASYFIESDSINQKLFNERCLQIYEEHLLTK